MHQVRRLRIQGRRFDLRSLARIGLIFDEQAALARRADRPHSLRFEVTSDDGTTYQSSDLDLLAEDSDAVLKSPVEVALRFTDYSAGDRVITFRAQHGDKGLSDLSVEGEDRKWVESSFTRARELIESLPPTTNWLTRHRTLVGFAACAGLGALVLPVWLAVVSVILAFWGVPSGAPPLQGVLVWLVSSPLGALPLRWFNRLGWGFAIWEIWVKDWFWSAFPSVELAFGPEHLRLAKRRRHLLAYAVGAVFLPLAVSLVYDIIQAG